MCVLVEVVVDVGLCVVVGLFVFFVVVVVCVSWLPRLLAVVVAIFSDVRGVVFFV